MKKKKKKTSQQLCSAGNTPTFEINQNQIDSFIKETTTSFSALLILFAKKAQIEISNSQNESLLATMPEWFIKMLNMILNGLSQPWIDVAKKIKRKNNYFALGKLAGLLQRTIHRRTRDFAHGEGDHGQYILNNYINASDEISLKAKKCIDKLLIDIFTELKKYMSESGQKLFEIKGDPLLSLAQNFQDPVKKIREQVEQGMISSKNAAEFNKGYDEGYSRGFDAQGQLIGKGARRQKLYKGLFILRPLIEDARISGVKVKLPNLLKRIRQLSRDTSEPSLEEKKRFRDLCYDIGLSFAKTKQD